MSISSHSLIEVNDALLPPQVDSFTVENYLDFSYGRCEIRRYSWSTSINDIFSFDHSTCAINFALTTRPDPTNITCLNRGPITAPVRVNRTLVIYPGTNLRLDAPKGQLRSLLCVMDIHKIEEMFHQQLDWSNPAFQQLSLAGIPDIEWLLDNISREVASNNMMREFAVESFANILCVRLFRHVSQCIENGQGPFRGGLSPAQLKVIRERINANQPAPTLDELATLCGISVRHLSRGFKQNTGHTLGKFIENATMERAFNLLKGTNLSIEAIARQLGYAGATSFACAFKRSTSFRPSDIDRPAP